MSEGRHRSDAVRRPSPVAVVGRLPRDARLSMATAGVAAAVLGTTTLVATVWPTAGSGAVANALTARGHQKAAADSLAAVASSRTEERTSRNRNAPPTVASTRPSTWPGASAAGRRT